MCVFHGIRFKVCEGCCETSFTLFLFSLYFSLPQQQFSQIYQLSHCACAFKKTPPLNEVSDGVWPTRRFGPPTPIKGEWLLWRYSSTKIIKPRQKSSNYFLMAFDEFWWLWWWRCQPGGFLPPLTGLAGWWVPLHRGSANAPPLPIFLPPLAGLCPPNPLKGELPLSPQNNCTKLHKLLRSKKQPGSYICRP